MERSGGIAFEIPDDDVGCGVDDVKVDGRVVSSTKKKNVSSVGVFLQARQALVHETVAHLGWHRVRQVSGQWAIAWIDTADAQFYRQVRSGEQRMSQMPGMEQLSRKKNLARNMNILRAAFPDDYNVFPRTWCLPEEYIALRDQFTDKRNRTFILKPDARCRGRGIFLTRSIEDIDPHEPQVCQRYMHTPYLIGGLKFDLRLYALITSVDPLRVYLFNDGLVRFCTEAYRSPTPANLDKSFSHLTNYSINKNNDKYEFNTASEDASTGSKWTYTALVEWMHANAPEVDTNDLWERIADVIVKTCAAGGAVLRHEYRVRFPADKDGANSFQLLGFDIMLNAKLSPYLVEVNRNPSLRCDTPLDQVVKERLLRDIFAIVQPPSRHSAPDLSHRLSKPRQFVQWRQARRDDHEVAARKRAAFERKRADGTGFRCVFPVGIEVEGGHDDAYYQRFIDHSQTTFDARYKSTGAPSSAGTKSAHVHSSSDC